MGANVSEVEVALQVDVVPDLAAVVKRAAEAAIQVSGDTPDGLGLTIVLADDAALAQLNQQFRGTAGPTDVLSFEAGEQLPGAGEEMAGYLGDVVISIDRAREQAEAAGHSLEAELALLAAHGTLHLLGYDHAEDDERRLMWQLQEEATANAIG